MSIICVTFDFGEIDETPDLCQGGKNEDEPNVIPYMVTKTRWCREKCIDYVDAFDIEVIERLMNVLDGIDLGMVDQVQMDEIAKEMSQIYLVPTRQIGVLTEFKVNSKRKKNKGKPQTLVQ